MSVFSRMQAFVSRMFREHLLLANTVTYSGLLSLGDCFVQNIEQLSLEGEKPAYNYRRTGRVFVLGLILGPLNHAWYKGLDAVVKGSGGKVVVKKILADQSCAAPFFCSSYIAGLGFLEGKGVSQCYEELREKFLYIYLVDWFVWPPAQFVNFYFLPTRFRVAYVSMITLCWNSFLSFVKHEKGQGQQAPLLEEIKK